MSKYLDKVGLEHYHDLIKDGLYEYIEGTQNSATSSWTGISTSPAITKGHLIVYHLPYAGSSSVPTLNLTLPDNTTTGAKTVGDKAGTFYAAGDNVILVYTGTSWGVVDGLNIDGAITSVVKSNLTANRALVSDSNGKVAVSATTANDLVNVQKNNLLSDETASIFGLDSSGTPDDVFDIIGSKLYDLTDWKVEKITSSTTWVAPNAFNSSFKIFGVGGGGGGGKAVGNPRYRSSTSYTSQIYAGGGGGGGYVTITDWIVIPTGTQVTVVCGAGGTGDNTTVTQSADGYVEGNGTDGGASSFGNYCTANGGKGGSGLSGGNGGAGGGGGVIKGNATYFTLRVGNGGNGDQYGGGGGTSGTWLSSAWQKGNSGTGGAYGGNGGDVSSNGADGTPCTFTEQETITGIGGTFSTTGTAGTSQGGGSGGYGGNGGVGKVTTNSTSFAGGGGGFGGNGGSVDSTNMPTSIGDYSCGGGGSGGGGNYGGNGGNVGGPYTLGNYPAKVNSGGGGGLLCNGGDGDNYCGGGGGGIVDGGSDGSGGSGGFYVLYKLLD